MAEKGRVFLLSGPGNDEKKQFIAQIEKNLSASDGEKPDTERRAAEDTDMVSFVADLRAGNLYARRRLAVLRNAEKIKQNQAAVLAGYCQKPAPHTTLILLSDHASRDVAKKIVDRIPKNQQKVFWPMFDNQKHKYLADYFRKKGAQIESGVIDLMLDLTENSKHQLAEECERLIDFYGKNHRLMIDDVEKYVYHSKPENVFTLFEKFLQSDFYAALETLRKILLTGDNQIMGVMGGLIWQIRRLRSFLVRGDHMPVAAALDRAAIRGKKNQQAHLEARKKYSSRDLDAIICLADKFEQLLQQSSGRPQTIILELFLYYAICRKGRAPNLDLSSEQFRF